MRLSPDEMIFWQHGLFKLNGTIVFTWALMFRIGRRFKLITRKLSRVWNVLAGRAFWKSFVTGIEKQIEDVGLRHPEKYIGFLGTLFLFVALASLCTIISRLRAADGVAFDHGCAGAVRVGGRAVFRHRGTGVERLPQVLR